MDCFLTKKSPSMCASFKINILNNKSIFGIKVIFCSLNLKVQTCFLKLAQALLSANYQAMKILIEWLGERDFFRFFCNRPIFSEMYKVKFNSVHLRHKKQSTISYDFPAHNEKSSFSCRVTFLKINNGASKAAGNLRKISDDNTQCVVPWSYNTESNIYFSASKKLLS